MLKMKVDELLMIEKQIEAIARDALSLAMFVIQSGDENNLN